VYREDFKENLLSFYCMHACVNNTATVLHRLWALYGPQQGEAWGEMPPPLPLIHHPVGGPARSSHKGILRYTHDVIKTGHVKYCFISAKKNSSVYL